MIDFQKINGTHDSQTVEETYTSFYALLLWDPPADDLTTDWSCSGGSQSQLLSTSFWLSLALTPIHDSANRHTSGSAHGIMSMNSRRLDYHEYRKIYSMFSHFFSH